MYNNHQNSHKLGIVIDPALVLVLCCFLNYFIWKQKVLCLMLISILKLKFVRKKYTYMIG